MSGLLVTLEDRAERERVLNRLASFHHGVVRRWGTLSAAGAMCHLALAYEMVLDPSLKCSERTGWWQRHVLAWLALHVPVRWPTGVKTLPELIEGAPGVQPGVFADDRARLLKAYHMFSDSSVVAGRAHPIFGPLTHWEWMRWGYLHADHHLRQFGL